MRVEFTKPAAKDLTKMEQTVQEQIVTSLKKLLSHPESADIKKLRGQQNSWRLRVGNWRVIFTVNAAEKVLYVLRIKHRREAY